jgi:hypothetical protein
VKRVLLLPLLPQLSRTLKLLLLLLLTSQIGSQHLTSSTLCRSNRLLASQ